MDKLSQEETAGILGVSTRQVKRMVKERILTVSYISNRAQYDPDEVAILASLRKRKVSLAQIATSAERAEAIALRTERALNRLLALSQISIPLLKYDRESVEALHIRVEDELKENLPPTVEDLFNWSKTFYSVGEEYFGLVSTYLDLEHPWELYLDLAGKLCVKEPFMKALRDPELATAYGCLNMSRRTMRQAAFFYVQRNYGKKIAHNMFPESKGDVQEDLIAIAMAFEPGGVFA